MPQGNGNPTTWCPRVKTIVAWHWEHHTHRLYPIRCKCWTCPFCYRKNLGHLIKKLEANPPERFITLTAKPGYMETPLNCYLRTRKYIRRLFQAAREKFGQQEYAVFCELHKSGFPHWHILQRGAWIPQRWLSAMWQKMTGAHIVDIRRCDGTRDAARYVCKYVNKGATNQRLDKRFRIVTFSKHFITKEKKIRLSKHWQIAYDRRHPEDVLKDYDNKYTVTYEQGYFEIRPKATDERIQNAETKIIAQIWAHTLDPTG